MLAAAVASGAASSASSVAVSTFAKVLISIVLGNFNPEYSRENRKRIRYLQQKYSLAYDGGKEGEDPCTIIEKIDPSSKLLMDPSGVRPLNPFPDERAFEDSLMINFHPVPGHQGRFVASHALACIGAIVDYQNVRRRRPWVPGVSNPGKPNDYVNMFLEETKMWMRHQMTLDSLSAEELTKRERFYAKIKNDNYYWCFPPEGESNSIHKVIDFIHEKVKNALEIVRREEMNKSLQTLFKEMNDHTTNVFEFGKHFLCFLLFHSKKMGANLSTTAGYEGRTIETGKLHFLLEKTTHVVFDTYVKDMEQTQTRIYGQRAIENGVAPTAAIRDNNAQEKKSSDTAQPPPLSVQEQHAQRKRYGYDISIRGFETAALSATLFLVKVEDPKGHQWIARRSWAEFEALHATFVKELSLSNADVLAQLVFPTRRGGALYALTNSAEYTESSAELLDAYCLLLMGLIGELTTRCHNALAKFLDARYIILSGSDALVHAESIANAFLPIKRVFQRQALFNNKRERERERERDSAAEAKTSADEDFVYDHVGERELDELRRLWGVEHSLKILDAYAQLQRIATLLGWTLEINHFFISMFGNTLAFSRLPLRDIVSALKELLGKFLNTAQDLYQFACQLNADAKYKWHSNLQTAENQLSRIKFHVEKALAVIAVVETDHLDYETQMRRLRDVYARFQPFVQRVAPSLHGIAEELGLTAPQFTFSELSHNTSYGGAESKERGVVVLPVEDKRVSTAHDKKEEEEGEEESALVVCHSAVNPRSIFSRSQSETSNPAVEHANPLQEKESASQCGTKNGSADVDIESSIVAVRTKENSAVCVVC